LTKFLERFTNHDHWCQWENGWSCFYDLIDKKLPCIIRANGAQVNIIEARARNQVNLDANKMQVQPSIPSTTNNFDINLISHRKHSNSRSKILIRLAGKYKKCWRITYISSKDGIEIRLKDIADVQDTQK
jgi:HAE1 family hydrophobic/amphiphilic exporter-1